MFYRKLKKRNAELELEKINLQTRIANQLDLLNKNTAELTDLQYNFHSIKLERLKDGNALSNLKKECNEKDEQIKTLQALVNHQEAPNDNEQLPFQDETEIEFLKAKILSQAGRIARQIQRIKGLTDKILRLPKDKKPAKAKKTVKKLGKNK